MPSSFPQNNRNNASNARGERRATRTESTEDYSGVRNAQAIRKTNRQEPVPEGARSTDVPRGILSKSGKVDSRHQTIDKIGRSDKAGSSDYRSVKPRLLRQSREDTNEQKTTLAYEAGTQHINQAAWSKLKKAQRARATHGQANAAVKKAAKVRAIRASIRISLGGISFWFVSLYFSFISIAGIGAAFLGSEAVVYILPGFLEEYFVNKAALPGLGLFIFGYIICFIFGLITIMVSIFWYTISRVRWATAEGIPYIAIAITCYLTPVLQLFPWFLLFVLGVIFTHERSSQDD